MFEKLKWETNKMTLNDLEFILEQADNDLAEGGGGRLLHFLQT